MDDETYMPFYHVPTRQESKAWVFEDDPMPTIVKSQRAMKKNNIMPDNRNICGQQHRQIANVGTQKAGPRLFSGHSIRKFNPFREMRVTKPNNARRPHLRQPSQRLTIKFFG
ncbi:hypothetical protein TNCV_3963531 [Trichonephila clavipes]|nr:hypothetical protein TNCV_3963531 [Trichonephila clavipes]